MRIGMQSRYLWQTLGLVSLAILILSTMLMYHFGNSTERISELGAQTLKTTLTERLLERGRSISENLAETVAEPFVVLDMRTAYQRIQETLAESGVEYVYLHDVNGQVVHDGTHEILNYGRDIAELQIKKPYSELEAGVRVSNSLLEIGRPIRSGNEVVGGVLVGMSLQPIIAETSSIMTNMQSLIRADQSRQYYGVIITTGVLLLLAAIVALLVARGLVRPIRQLATYADQVGKGNYEAMLPIRRSDELGDLAVSLREMSNNLQVTSGEVHYLAYHDSLTRLPNRAQLKVALKKALARAKRSETSAALLFIDLDDFKRVNDTLGHEAGDTLLKEFAMRLAESIRIEDEVAAAVEENADVIARLGGDEFTVVLDSIVKPADVVTIAQRILNAGKEPFIIAGQEVVVGASIGITTYPEDGNDVDTLLRNADVAMYQAKARGKNQFEFYNDSMHRMATERLSLEADLRHALHYDQMRLVYQPVIDINTNEIVIIDSKVRWMHPALGVIHPDVFIPLAEQTGFIVELDEWVVKSVCSDLKLLHNRGYTNQKMAAKLSSVHFRDHSIGDVVNAALEDNNLSAQSLCLKVDEKTIMRNFPRASKILNELRASGVNIVVDAFGSGHSPLNYLTKLPVDSLKIANEYIRQINQGEHEKAIVAIIVAMAHSLKLKVIAEGVESQEQMEIVQSIACDMVQGSYYTRPMLCDDLITYLEKHINERNEFSQTGTFSAQTVALLKTPS
ncbi:MAG: EAL domain-containing protein [Gammaproteobacteria bacterium]|nr:EAL domain-containing protein [Gammaproteobacteria bacterium]